MSTNKRVHVQIADKEYQVVCPPEEREALLKAAGELDLRMRQVRNSGSVVGSDRVAVMVALNLCYELQQSQNKTASNPASSKALESLASKLDLALETCESVK